MPLSANARLGPYEIVAQIGAGGMGEVYEARDTKLGRNVAIKVLPAAFANDLERLSRFQREARVLAALNHPNIATIYGLEHFEGVHFLIMELVSGETLAERLKAGPVPMDEALKIAVQIAEALEAAHEKNIIHRDLKPANVKVTLDGKVKVLDFGLAKAFEGDLTNEDMNNSPTLSVAATMQGVILGTAGYMSPEQARGKATDKRTDIWAFGCVLYELLTGKRAFQGETVTDITAKILTGEPGWQALPELTLPQIRRLLRRCLQKEKSERLRDAGDARLEIQEALSGPVSAMPTAGVPRSGGDWRQIVVLSLSAVALLAIGVVVTWNLKPAVPQRVTRAVINLPPGQQLAGLDRGSALALSPDGTHLAYVALQGGVQRIYLRPMESLQSMPMPDTEGATAPFFSPDGQWLGFFTGEKLKKIPVGGGSALALANTTLSNGGSWSGRATIAFPATAASSLQQIADAGGTPQPLTHLEKGEISHRWPEFLPGDKAILFAAANSGINYSNSEVAAQFIATRERRNLIQGGTQPHYLSSGHLIYAQRGNLMATPFDPKELRVTGAGELVVAGIVQSVNTGVAQYAVSGEGTLVYVPGGVQSAQSRLVWVNRSGVEQPLAAPLHSYFVPRISPDSRRIAVAIWEQETQVWQYDPSRDTLTRLTFQGSANFNPLWTPDGKRIAFDSNAEGPLNIFWQLSDGSGSIERLTTSQYINAPMSWSADGRLLSFTEVNSATGLDIWVLRRGDSPAGAGQIGKAEPFLQTPFNEGAARFSPDGRWMAYVSDESGRYEVYVQPYPGPGGKWQISSDGGNEPVWNPNGKELFYRSGDKMMAADITTQPGFAAGKPRMLFEGPYESPPFPIANYDVSPDGQRFLMIKPAEQAQSAPTQINIVLNWFEELKRRVPAGK